MESGTIPTKITIDIYTDGACKNNPGPGGWAGILIYQICDAKEINQAKMNEIANTIEEFFNFNSSNFDHFKCKECMQDVNDEKIVVKIGGNNIDTTNNRMEMLAVINSLYFYQTFLNFISQKYSSKYSTGQTTLFTDSMYVKDGIEKWIHGWEKNNWKTAQKKPVKNQDLWQKISMYNRNIHWQWVQGHSGNKWNDEADKISKFLSNNI